MKRSKWKQQRTEAGLRNQISSIDATLEVGLPHITREYRGKSLGFTQDKKRIYSRLNPKTVEECEPGINNEP